MHTRFLTAARSLKTTDSRVDAPTDRERIVTEPVPDDAIVYMCPICCREGHATELIEHRVGCAIKRLRKD